MYIGCIEKGIEMITKYTESFIDEVCKAKQLTWNISRWLNWQNEAVADRATASMVVDMKLLVHQLQAVNNLMGETTQNNLPQGE